MDIEETARTGATCGGDARSGRERRDRVPLMGDPRFPPGSFYYLSSDGILLLYYRPSSSHMLRLSRRPTISVFH